MENFTRFRPYTRVNKTKRWLGLLVVCMTLFTATAFAQLYQVAGTCTMNVASTTYGPMNSSTNSSATNRTAVIYPASQLTGVAGQELTAIYFNRIGATADPTGGTPNFKLYFKETSSITFGSGAVDWSTLIDGATLVYDANPLTAISGGLGWKQIVLSNNYVYSGTNNLMVLMEYVNTGNTTNVQWQYEYTSPCVNTSDNNTTKYINTTTGVLGTSLSSSDYRRPQIAFDYTVDCPAPSNVVVSDITTNEATFTWDAGGSETTWHYAIQPQGTGIPTSYETTSSTTLYVNNLLHSTPYEFYVRASCGGDDGDSVWKGPYNFLTPCGAIVPPSVTQTFTGFTGSAPATLPCWSEATGTLDNPLTGTTSTWTYQTYNSNINASHPNGTAAYINLYGTDNEWLISPPVDLGDGSIPYQLEYDVSITPYTGVAPVTDMGEKFVKVVISTDGGDTWSSSNVLHTYDNSDIPDGGREDIINLTGYTGIVKFAFYAHSTATTNDTKFYIDNWRVVPVPTCPKPTFLGVSDITFESAVLTWTSDGTTFDIEFGEQGFTPTGNPSAGLEGVSNPYTLTGLEAETNYQYYVRQNCGDGDFSTWAGPFSFYTGYCLATSTGTGNRITGFATTDGYTNINNLSNGTTNGYNNYSNMVVTQSPGGTFNYTITVPANTVVDIWIDIDQNFIFDPVNELLASHDALTTTYTGSFTIPAGMPLGDYRIRMRSRSNTTASNPCGTLANGETEDYTLRIIPTPTCYPPTELSSANISANSVDLSWTSTGTNFDILWGELDFDTETEGTLVTDFTNGGTLSGLSAMTTYQVYIRQNCGDGDTSIWIGPITFTTLCDSVTELPYIENFDTYGTGSNAFPDCWLRPVTYDNGTIWPSIVAVAGSSTPNSLRFQSLATDPTYAVSPAFAEDIQNLRVKFNLRREGVNSGTIEFGVMSDPYDPSTFEVVDTIDPTDNVFHPYMYDLNMINLAGGNNHIAFRHNSVLSNWYYWLDDFRVELIPSCVEPANLNVISVSYYSAELAWESLGDSFDIEYGLTGFVPTRTPSTGLTGVSNPYTLTGLTPATAYQYYVRQNCGDTDGTSIWVGPYNFTTECLPPSITGTTAGSVCGLGEVTLSATADDGATIAWFDSEIGGNQLAEGPTFTTPVISETTSYWVGAYTGGGTEYVGPVDPSIGTGGYVNYDNYVIYFTVTATTTIESVDIFTNSALGTTGSLVINDITNGGIVGTYPYTVTQTGSLTTGQTVTINQTLPPGDYSMGMQVAMNLYRNTAGASFPYTAGDLTITGHNFNGYPQYYYYFYNWAIGGGCHSERTEVVATVTTPPALELSEAELSICEGETSDTVTITTGAADYDTFVWTPSTGVTGDATTGWTFNPTTTTTYTLTASQSSGAGCITTLEFEVIINPNPAPIEDSTETTCVDSILALSPNGGLVTIEETIGTETNLSTANTTTADLGPNPLQTYYGNTKQQWIYTADELTNIGFVSGSTINSITLHLSQANNYVLNNLTVKMKNSTTTAFASTSSWESDMVVVKDASSHTTVVGDNTFVLDTPFLWDGVSNLVVEINYMNDNSGGGTGNFTRAYYSNTSFNSTLFYRYDGTAHTADTYTGTATAMLSKRNNVTFSISNPVTITWTPQQNLYIDSAATIPYTAQTDGTLLYFKSSTQGTFNYTLTATTPAGCETSGEVEVVVNPAVAAPTGDTTQTLENGATLADLVVNGTNLVWYADADLTQVIPTTTVAVDGTTYYVVSEAGDCQSAALAITVMADPCADITTPTGPDAQTLLIGQTLANLTVSGDNLVWYADAALTTVLPETTVAVNGTTYYVASVTDVCVSEPLAITVYIEGVDPCDGVTVPAPTGEALQTVSEGTTLADLVVDGENLQWYADAELTQELDSTTVVEDGVTYYVTQTIGLCTSAEALEVTVQVTVGREDFDSFAFRFYPNPVGDVLNLTSNSEISNIDLFNMLGQKVTVVTNANNTQIGRASCRER